MVYKENYKLQVFFPNDWSIWRASVQGLFNMSNIKSPWLHQCRHDSKVMTSSFFNKASSNLQETHHPGFACQHSPFDLIKLTSIFHCKLLPLVGYHWVDEVSPKLELVNLKIISKSSTNKLTSTHRCKCSPYH